MKNTGRASEKIFDDSWARLGKRAYVFKFTDAAEARGTNKKAVHVKAQPADRMLTYQGVNIYAEIKSTWDPDAFRFSLLRDTQSAYAAFVLAAGGPYDVFIHSLAYDRWYRVPYAVIKAAPNRSMKWPELESYAWNFPT